MNKNGTFRGLTLACCLCVVAFCAQALDFPHSPTVNNISCLNCHDMSSFYAKLLRVENPHPPQDIDDTIFNNLCWSCHNGVVATARQTHSSLTTDNGDGKDDVLLRHERKHQWYYYSLDGTRVLAGGGIDALPRTPQWQPAGIGDFDGDGADELMLRHGDGRQWQYYPLDGRRARQAKGGTAFSVPGDWRLAGSGDFNGDGCDDFLLRHPRTHSWYFWPVNQCGAGKRAAGGGSVDLPRDRQWQVAGIGDYNGDGTADVLLRHELTGQWHYYSLRGSQLQSGSGGAAITPDSNWLAVTQ